MNSCTVRGPEEVKKVKIYKQIAEKVEKQKIIRLKELKKLILMFEWFK